jgi:hypothetical protein
MSGIKLWAGILLPRRCSYTGLWRMFSGWISTKDIRKADDRVSSFFRRIRPDGLFTDTINITGIL